MSRTPFNHNLYRRMDEPSANRLHIMSLALLELRTDGRASRVYINEIAAAIENGLLLAAIELSTTLLEIWIRDLLVVYKVRQVGVQSKIELRYLLTKIDREIEGIKRGVMFEGMCKQLLILRAIEQCEHDKLVSIYKEIRIPLHHGISGRLIEPTGENLDRFSTAKTKEEMLLASIVESAPHRRADHFEDYIDASIVQILEDIVDFITAHQIPRIGMY